MYGSSFCSVTRRRRLFRSRPRDAAVRPFPMELATPPVTKMCFATGVQPTPAGDGAEGWRRALRTGDTWCDMSPRVSPVRHGEPLGLNSSPRDADRTTMGRRTTAAMALAVGFVIGVAPLAAPPALAAGPAVVQVPADQPTVQRAIDVVADGGRVVVAPGVYHERLNFHGRAVQVTSAQGPQVTILDGDHLGDVVSFVSGEGRGALLQGFTLRNGQVAAVAIGGSAPTLTGNVLDGTGTTLIGIEIMPGSPLVQGNRITGFGTGSGYGGYGAGISIGGAGHAELVGNTIDHNAWAGSGGGIAILGTNDASVRDNVIRDNSATADGGG